MKKFVRFAAFLPAFITTAAMTAVIERPSSYESPTEQITARAANARGTATNSRGVSGTRNRPSTSATRTNISPRPTASASGTPARTARTATPRRLAPTSKNVASRQPATNSRSARPATVARTGAIIDPRKSGTSNRARATSAVKSRNAILSTSARTAARTATAPDAMVTLTETCRAQYTQCMDNFCNVLDDTQGRCSCSKNLKNYEKTEQALQAANEALQDVAQQIQYIGLSADEVTSLFAQTEAELQMSKTNDNSQLKNDLDKIKSLIVDVKSGTAAASDTSIGVDFSGLLSFDIDSAGFDLGGILGTSNTNTSSINNQRGEQLYKTATARCKTTVLNNCAAQGVDVSIITGAYDLEIDKQCIVYERTLTESNTNMSRTVRNAQNVLQRARLMVAQNKNQYDLRGCVNALDTCMQDDYVCGTDYEYCLDPTGKYIVNGEIVSGSLPGVSGGDIDSETSTVSDGLYATWNYNNTSNNAWGKGKITDYIENSSNDTSNMAVYLKSKIGSIDENGKSSGMCASVLNKCQNFTYSTKSAGQTAYDSDNQVIKTYLERTLVQIKSAQDTILADYAEECISDVNTCLSDNNYTYNRYSYNTSNVGTISNAAVQACLPIINTCKSVTERKGTTTDVAAWLQDALNVTIAGNTPTIPDTPDTPDEPDTPSESQTVTLTSASDVAKNCPTISSDSGVSVSQYVSTGTSSTTMTVPDQCGAIILGADNEQYLATYDTATQDYNTNEMYMLDNVTSGTVNVSYYADMLIQPETSGYSLRRSSNYIRVMISDNGSVPSQLPQSTVETWKSQGDFQGIYMDSEHQLYTSDGTWTNIKPTSVQEISKNETVNAVVTFRIPTPEETACLNTGGYWDNGACNCTLQLGTIESNGVCICDKANHFISYNNDAHCTCESGYIFAESTRTCDPIIDQNAKKACEESGGTYQADGTCTCKAQFGAVEENGICVCDTSKFFKPGVFGTSANCECQDGYEPTGAYTCALPQDADKQGCIDSGGSWAENSYCSCYNIYGAEDFPDSNVCTCDASKGFIGDPLTGCKCPDGWVDNEGTCVVLSEYEQNCINSGGTVKKYTSSVSCDCSTRGGTWKLNTNTGECMDYSLQQYCAAQSDAEWAQNKYCKIDAQYYWQVENSTAAKEQCNALNGTYGLVEYRSNLASCHCVKYGDMSYDPATNGCLCPVTFVPVSDPQSAQGDTCTCPANTTYQKHNFYQVEKTLKRYNPNIDLASMLHQLIFFPVYGGPTGDLLYEPDGVTPIDYGCVLGYSTDFGYICKSMCRDTQDLYARICRASTGTWDSDTNECLCDAARGMKPRSYLHPYVGVTMCKCASPNSTYDLETASCKCDDGYIPWTFDDGTFLCTPPGSVCDPDTRECTCDESRGFEERTRDPYSELSYTCGCIDFDSKQPEMAEDGFMTCVPNPYDPAIEASCTASHGDYYQSNDGGYICGCYDTWGLTHNTNHDGCICKAYDNFDTWSDELGRCACKDGYTITSPTKMPRICVAN